MNAFDHIVKQIQKPTLHHDTFISRGEYDVFCKEFIFDKLRGMTFGQSFCKRFNIHDTVLDLITDEEYTREHIELYWIK
jgi:hypothetical protein